MAITKFEQIGVNLQQESYTIDEAVNKFDNSCNICCCKGIRLECNKCAINYAHKLVVACLADKMCETK